MTKQEKKKMFYQMAVNIFHSAKNRDNKQYFSANKFEHRAQEIGVLLVDVFGVEFEEIRHYLKQEEFIDATISERFVISHVLADIVERLNLDV